ncbi:hypothetical protein N3K66_002105 [Trichothecium roseum]|uniref:Uncharacterized protein n=1 Tax=Trichothecium roseum TaxID=47278 RepID=A0ACC0VBA8_9HYPO|nr:hypothetical protein N3K66_002105 [Trichothecium roseum]
MQRGEVKTWKGSPEFGRRIAVTVAAAPTITATPPTRNLLGLELKRAAPARAYPSPPMSRSSPSPQKAQDAADHGYGPSDYPSNLQYARGGAASHHPLTEPQNQQSDQFGRSHHLERIDRMPYAYQRPADYPNRPLSYPGPSQPSLSPNATQPAYLTMASSSSAAPGFPMAASTLESKPLTSPKSQRKIKGHVASACVPCKRAHLR